MSEQVKLGELEPGALFKKGDTYGMKSEYRNSKGTCESYIIGSGEMFWGGTGNPNALKVEPIDFELLIKKAEKVESLQKQLDAKLVFINNGWEEERYALQNKVVDYENALIEIKGKTLDSSYAYEIAHSALYKHQE